MRARSRGAAWISQVCCRPNQDFLNKLPVRVSKVSPVCSFTLVPSREVERQHVSRFVPRYELTAGLKCEDNARVPGVDFFPSPARRRSFARELLSQCRGRLSAGLLRLPGESESANGRLGDRIVSRPRRKNRPNSDSCLYSGCTACRTRRDCRVRRRLHAAG